MARTVSTRLERNIRVPAMQLPTFTQLANTHVQLLNLTPTNEPGTMQANVMATDQELYQLGMSMGRETRQKPT